ncbi:NAD-dependent epimerase/dehydratase family protein [Propioniciclava coleopterorum]|uniref:NAD-dependent epimerase/dehydratase family protein n=1 Tax=Propioniciclava coleopterorum TaxID=2714937 RepID=A0A6G7Y3Y2_9ACTN|nr:NAD-dependent epimerase/dehydratase family protein [Propioniciclava coleopterorum]QIK71530.1 NAD-dependent epimerase/dehydratase family protein [Propioniciclava coleopterorum]
MARALVLGGTGLLGFHTVTELLRRGNEVTSVSLPGSDQGTLAPEVTAVWADLTTLPDADLLDLFAGHDALFYAIGADERTIPAAPAARFFYQANVLPTQRIARLAREAGVKKFVLYGSYTAEFAQRWTDIAYRENPYPRTRLLQEEVAIMEGAGAMDVMVLRLPYIFGLVAGQRPLWQFVLDRASVADQPVTVLGGTTSSVTAEQVAQAAVGAMERGEHGATYAINGYDLSYAELYTIACTLIGRDPADVVVVPLDAVLPTYQKLDDQLAAQGVEHGVHLPFTAMFQERDAVTDPAATLPVLGVEEQDVVAALTASLQWCVDHPVQQLAAAH